MSKNLLITIEINSKIDENIDENINKSSNLKEKSTFNLSKTILNDLEDVWIEIRRLRGDKKISKTEIVERAIEEAIKDFWSHKESSKFYENIEIH